MQKQYDTLPTGLPEWNGTGIDDFDLPDYMFKDPIHYSEEWFAFIEKKVKDENLADEYKQIMINIMHKRHGVDVRLSLAIFVYIIAQGFTGIVTDFEKIVKDVAEFKSWGVSEVEAMKIRIDNLIINATGTNIAEVVDARVSIDGTIQATLGNRLLKDFTDRLTKAQLIRFLAGEDIEVTIKSDFNTPPKIAGSIVENENIFKRSSSPALQSPSGTWVENTQENYDSIMKLDESVSRYAYMTNGAIASKLISYNALWILEKNFPLIFKNATSTLEKVAIAKNKITNLNLNAYGKGSGPNGNKFYLNAFNVASGAWATPVSHALSTIGKLTYSYHRPDILLSSEGLINVAMYTDSSNGTVASSVSIDYPNIELTVKFNINEFAVSPSQLEAMRVDLQTKLDKLQTLVDTKQDKLYESGLRYPSLGGGAGSHTTFRVHYEKSGRLVSFGGRLLLPLVSAGAQVRIGSVPSQFAPQIQKFYEVAVAGRQTDLFANIVIDTDGQIYCYYCNTASQYFSLDLISYLTKE
ncbi:hypothetical protein [Carnobacterium maltaromaticum]|uniref:hypothetical protein n=1 Tax=Carnobacterium maltaromaticum TaxID=2751 RepID=UPI0039AF61E5